MYIERLLGVSPYFMVYGQECSNPVDYALLPQTQQLKYPNWKNTRDKVIQRWNDNRKTIIEMNHKNKLSHQNAKEPKDFLDGDKVLTRNHIL
eukprot:Pgem_evm1s8121